MATGFMTSDDRIRSSSSITSMAAIATSSPA